MTDNTQLHTIIKLRHLKSASYNNWEMLTKTKKMVDEIISEAHKLMVNYGKSLGKEQFKINSKSLDINIMDIQEELNSFYQFIKGEKSINVEESFTKFNNTLDATNELFNTISSYPKNYFKATIKNDWIETWNVIKSNMAIIQGAGESAYIKSLMIKNFNKTEVDALTSEIVKHIPQSFNLLEADKYKKEYLQAVKDIEKESNAKDNLWDRFLNVLAGLVPFKQSPEERVMMSRWIDGEKGEL